jgi:1,4-alpha-glucan branching enzyme
MRRTLLAGAAVLCAGSACGACGSDAITAVDAGSSSSASSLDGGAGHPAIDGSAAPHDAGRSDGPIDAGADAADAGPPSLGATVGPNGVTFRVWAPSATAARVTGDFTPTAIPMAPAGGGVFEVSASSAHAGSAYAFSLDTPSGTVARVDPYCRQLSGSAACNVIDPATYAWKAPSFTRPARTGAVVYELHVGSFSVPAGASGGTFASVTASLPQLADLGVTAIELMPVQDFGSGPVGWGYNPQLYFAPKPSYGSADDLRALVDAAHGLGIGVWLDTVVNHCDGWSQAPLRCFDGECPDGGAGVYFFPSGAYATTPWGPRPDYPAPQVLAMLLAAADTWMDEFHGDGFRWDSVSNIRAIDGNGTTPGGQALLTQANARIHAKGGLSVAEDLKGYAAITQPTSAGGFGFDAQWDGFGYTIDAQLALAADASRDLGAVIGALTSSYAGDPFARLAFTEDHDTVGNGGSRLPNQIDSADPASWAARKRSILGAVMLLSAPAVPMIFMGQEFLATGTFANPPPPLAAPTAQGLQIEAFYKDMIRLRRNLDGGAGGLQDSGIDVFHRNDAAKVVGYRRYGTSGEDVVVVVNLMNKAYTEYDVGVEDAGPWRIRLNTDSTAYGSDFAAGETGSVEALAGTKDGKPYTLPLVLGAYSAMVLTH